MYESWIYLGIFLPKNEKAKLLERFKEYIPEGWKVYCDHMTVVFNDHTDGAKRWAEAYGSEVNKRFGICGVKLGKSDRALALQIETDMSANKTPHITIAVAPGAKPVESNKITEWAELDEPIMLYGTLNFFSK